MHGRMGTSQDRIAGGGRETLALLRDLDFDALVPWPSQAGRPAVEHLTPDLKARQIDALVARLKAGAPGPTV